MKLITFIVPAFNSQAYLHHAIDSLIIAGDDIEIIIVNDGSKDETSSTAHVYEKNYPSVVKVIDKENGGHGSAINAGLKQAEGMYVKVLDSDDWVDQDSLLQLLIQIKTHKQNHLMPDLYITNFVYEHVLDHTSYERDYSQNFLENEMMTWSQIKKRFRNSKTLLMHALIYKTNLLKDIKLTLPEHTFYVDNIVAYIPLPHVKSMYYMKIPFYRYFIGRADQSVTLKNITARYQQQIRVFRLMSDMYTYAYIKTLPKKLAQYMKHYIASMLIITQMFTVASDDQIRRKDLKELWEHLKTQDKKLYHFLKYQTYNTFVHFLPWKIKSFVMVKGYLYLVKKVKLG